MFRIPHAAAALVCTLAFTVSELVAAESSTVQVTLANFAFSPNPIELRHDSNYTLRLVNTATGGHSFSAREFFAAANLASVEGSVLKKGTIEVPGRSTVTIGLKTGPAGVYSLKCTHTLHSTFGMKGQIIVR